MHEGLIQPDLKEPNILKKDTGKHKTLTGYDFRIDTPFKPSKAIKEKCVECSGSYTEMKLCEIYDCPLWPLRPGFKKKRECNLTDEQKKVLSERMKGMLEHRKRGRPRKEVS